MKPSKAQVFPPSKKKKTRKPVHILLVCCEDCLCLFCSNISGEHQLFHFTNQPSCPCPHSKESKYFFCLTWGKVLVQFHKAKLHKCLQWYYFDELFLCLRNCPLLKALTVIKFTSTYKGQQHWWLCRLVLQLVWEELIIALFRNKLFLLWSYSLC